jgi:hypothetical protein
MVNLPQSEYIASINQEVSRTAKRPTADLPAYRARKSEWGSTQPGDAGGIVISLNAVSEEFAADPRVGG